VFRHFDVVTVFWEFEPGLVVNVFAPKFRSGDLSARLGDFIQRHVSDPRIVATASAELGIQEQPVLKGRAAARVASPLMEHLNANGEFYTKRYLKYLELRRDLSALHAAVLGGLARREGTKPRDLDDMGRSLRWSRTHVQGESIYTPLAPPEMVKAVPGLDNYQKACQRLEKFRLKRVERHKDVHLFAGTVVEPAPGDCVLKNLPQGGPP
jgi:hypothetical protein